MSDHSATPGPARPTDIEIMQWMDGELDREREAEVRAFVESDARARQLVDSLAFAGALLREGMLDHATEAGADTIAAAVMGSVDGSGPRSSEPAQTVVPVRDSAARKGRARWAIVTGGLSVALAAAAAWVVWAKRQVIDLSPGFDARSVLVVGATPHRSPNGAHAEVNAVDLGGRGGTLYYVRSETGSIPVLWIDDANARSRP